MGASSILTNKGINSIHNSKHIDLSNLNEAGFTVIFVFKCYFSLCCALEKLAIECIVPYSVVQIVWRTFYEG